MLFLNVFVLLVYLYRTALHEAVSFFHKDVAQYLVKKGANLTLKSGAGETPIDLARRLGFTDEEIGIYFGIFILDCLFKQKCTNNLMTLCFNFFKNKDRLLDFSSVKKNR